MTLFLSDILLPTFSNNLVYKMVVKVFFSNCRTRSLIFKFGFRKYKTKSFNTFSLLHSIEYDIVLV